MERKQTTNILQDLAKKMVLLVGPRQVGKTYIAKQIAKKFHNAIYLNYDHFEDRNIIHNAFWPTTTELLILDEIHKMPNWKNHLKGIYDTKPSDMKILVTGSARLDLLKQVGDSLAGRYFTHRLLPLSPAELMPHEPVNNLERLKTRGGFPEPFLAASDIDATRWRNQYVDALLREDVFTFDNIHNLRAMQLTFELLRRKIGSPISCKSIADDVGIAPNTVKKYLRIFESLYLIFKITPYSRNIARSLSKEPKIYFFDSGLVIGDNGPKLENAIAVSLLKHVFLQQDYQGIDYELQYLRTKDGAEVDFALVKNSVIEQIIEVKSSDKNISKHLYHFSKKYNIPAVQLVENLRQEQNINGIEVRRAINFLKDL